MSEYKKTIEKLLDSEISAYKINKVTGISTGRISDLRTGKRQLDGVSLKVTEKLYNLAMSIELVKDFQRYMSDNFTVTEVDKDKESKTYDLGNMYECVVYGKDELSVYVYYKDTGKQAEEFEIDLESTTEDVEFVKNMIKAKSEM